MISACMLFCSLCALAQEQTPLPTDRPGQANNPQTLGTKQFILQNGLVYNHTTFNDIFGSDELRINTFSNQFNVRYGLLPWLELNGNITYDRVTQNSENFDASFTVDGISLFSLGIRAKVVDLNGGKTTVSLLALVDTDIVTDVFSSNSAQLRMAVLFSQQITDKLGLTINAGYFQPDQEFDFYNYAVNLSYQVSPTVSAFVEVYGDGLLNNRDFFSVDNTFYDGGVLYLINNSLSVDLAVGYGSNFNGAQKDYMVAAGISKRFGGG